MERSIHNTRVQGSGVRGQKNSARRGFTLAESLIASVVLAAAVVGISGTLSASFQQTEAMEQRAQAISLARQLLEEIAARPFEDPTGVSAPGPESNETAGRAIFDNIDDYHGFTDASTPASATPQVVSIDAAAASAQYTRSVSVEYRATPNGAAANSGPFALVSVRVATPRGTVVSLSQLVCDYSRGQ